MTKYLLLRVEDDDQADQLLRDILVYPHMPLLTPCAEARVSVELVADIDPSDRGQGGRWPTWTVGEAVIASCLRADELAAEWWAAS